MMAILASARVAFAAQALPPILDNGTDETLRLYASREAANPAPPGSPAPNPDPKNFEGVWWLRRLPVHARAGALCDARR